jgi:hypothetical protein
MIGLFSSAAILYHGKIGINFGLLSSTTFGFLIGLKLLKFNQLIARLFYFLTIIIVFSVLGLLVGFYKIIQFQPIDIFEYYNEERGPIQQRIDII